MAHTIGDRIYLIGMMASGKSTVGKLLADQLGYDFVDMDAVIESELGTSINAIFSSQGEAYFRNLEHELLCKLANQDRAVISTGGGTPIYHQGIEIMNKSGTIVWLKASKEVIHKRISETKHRPLANKMSKYALSKIIKERNSIYKQAHIKVWVLTPIASHQHGSLPFYLSTTRLNASFG